MDEKQITQQLEYHYWASHKMLLACKQLSAEQLKTEVGGSFGSLFETLAHMYSAEDIWLSRWQGIEGVGFTSGDAFADFSDLEAKWKLKEEELSVFLKSADVNEVHTISYGENRYLFPLWELVLHLIDHSSFHRGQVVNMLRDAGQVPPKTNFIHYLLEQKEES